MEQISRSATAPLKDQDSFAAGLDAARQAASGIREHSISLALVFASVRYDMEEMLRGIQQVVPGAPILGTTTAGEICNGIRSGSVVVVLFASPYIKVAAGIGERVSSSWGRAVLQAVSDPGLAPYFGADIGGVHKRMTLEGKQAFGMIFSPGNTRHSNSCSFEILEKLKQLSENRLPFFGGSSADDWRLETNFALLGGKAYEDSLLVAVIETSLQFGMALNHGFRPGPEKAVITRAEGHEIKELNDRPQPRYSRDSWGSRPKNWTENTCFLRAVGLWAFPTFSGNTESVWRVFLPPTVEYA